MYAAHFAFGLVIQFYFLDINPFLITFGVGLLDIVFGYLANYKYEKILIDENQRLVYYRPFSHSLFGSIFISLFWACLGFQNHTILPLFFTVFSHFILDFIVKNMKSYSQQRIYYCELIFCLICSSEVLRKNYDDLQFDTHGLLLIVAIMYIFYLHYRRRLSACEEAVEMLRRCPEERRGSFIFLIIVQQWIVPALSLAVILYVFIHNTVDLFSLLE